ncbi:multiple epidermal growth factor-like domains protein 10 isoform X1 [Mya arenaria]|uniref:multiple epidermal growth factor-like domains protein 10 isoform X1 n=1 Tax=Mya arenaria TaxID=6604 RepID=UPI0022E9712A|nr:multiple epidermal growth factor-like domains protein 10 isoform X1 [Mya arenaria]XP_052763991.1 multiple epidermal growth factor-like domains protein 10 isoform X1 [Mya arenaria]XP_052763993.1 multiple epidermal growth factor-like domains protein 10 isoform X1 [Mya arenaria]
MNRYKGYNCTDTCTGHCLNKTCQQYNGSCVHGCDDRFYGRKCFYTCKSVGSNCLVCTSNGNKFSSCTRCINGSYPGSSGKCVPCKPNCSGGCNSSTGVCYACVDGYSWSFCNVSCTTNCKSCLQSNDQCNVCKEEFWGSDCFNNCSTNCKHGNDSISTCDINSGNCKHGCLPETHGLQCSIPCDKHCLTSEGGVRECNQMDGQCRLGCENEYTQTHTGCIDASVGDQIHHNGGAGDGTSGSVIGGAIGGTSGSVIGVAIGGVLTLLTVALGIGLCILIRRRREDSTDGPETDTAEKNSVVYQNTSASASIYNELNDKTGEVKPSKAHENNSKETPTTSTNDNKLDRASD